MVTAPDKNIEQKNLNKKKHNKKETKKAVSQINKILPYVKKTQYLKEIHSSQCQTVVTLTRGASRYYTLPKGDLGATTVKELAPLHWGRTLSPDTVIVLLPRTMQFADKQ